MFVDRSTQNSIENEEIIKSDLPVINLGVDTGMTLVGVMDRGETDPKKRIILPIMANEAGERLGKLGYKNRVVVEADMETQAYLTSALIRMPYLLAVQATFNMNPRPDLNDFPVYESSIPPAIIGMDGPPRSGSTMFLLHLAAVEPPNVIGVRDFDNFSSLSVTNTLDLIKQKIGDKKDDLKFMYEMIMEVYKENLNKKFVADSDYTLSNCLSAMVEEFRGGRSVPKMYWLDLPGVDENTTNFDAFHLLRCSMPVVDVGEIMANDLELVNIDPVEVPFGDRYGTGEFAPHTFFYKLRSVILPTGRLPSEQTLLWICKKRSMEIQMRMLEGLINK